jgi:hypothetical protein
MVEYEEGAAFDDIQIIIGECRTLIREDTSVERRDEESLIVSLGEGIPVFYQVYGEEFQQAFVSLSHPSPTFYATPDSFSVDEFVCIGCPGTYWGDVGLIRSLPDSKELNRISVLLVPRMTDPINQAAFDKACARPPMRKTLWFHTEQDSPLSIEGGEETWSVGREKLTKDGMVLRTFAPWELRKDMIDGNQLYLLPDQDAHFRRVLAPERWSDMPPVHSACPRFIRGERVQVSGHKAIVVSWDKSAGRTGSVFAVEHELIYSEMCQAYFACHPSFLVKQHKEGDMVFSFGVQENVVVLDCDYLKQEVKIQLRATAARKYKKEPLVSRYS